VDAAVTAARIALATAANTGSNAREVFYAARLMVENANESCASSCSAVSLLVKRAAGVQDIYYAASAARACGCSLELSASQVDAVSTPLQQAVLEPYCYAVLTAPYAGIAVDAEAVVQQLSQLMGSDGIFKVSQSSADGSLQGTRLAVDTLVSVSKEAEATRLRIVAENLIQLLPTDEDENQVDPTLLGPITTLLKEKLPIGSARLLAIANALIGYASEGTLDAVYRALASLRAVNTYKTAPIFLMLTTTSFISGQEFTIEAAVLDVFSDTVKTVSLEIKSILDAAGDEKLASVPGSLSETGLHLFSMPALPAGVYKAKAAAVVEGRAKPVILEAFYVCTAGLSVSAVSIGIGESKELTMTDMNDISYPNQLDDTFIARSANFDVVHVAFKVVSAVTPQQVFACLTHLDTNLQTFFLAKPVGSGASYVQYAVAISTADESEAFLYRSGTYNLSLIVADAAVISSEQWSVGQMYIELGTQPRKEYPLYARALLHDSDTTLLPLPEIMHKFREPARRAPVTVSLVFTVLCLLPLGLLGMSIIALRPDLKRFDLAGALFAMSFGAFLMLFALYWLFVPLYSTLAYLLPLSILTFITGQRALSTVASKPKKTKQE
jgi:hypothetical protein